MATLEKIRQKSVLLIVVIGVALLAFIIGDFISSSRSIFGNDRTVASVGSEKIDIVEFQNRYNEATQQMQGNSQNIDHAVLQEQLLESMVQETLMNNEVEALGIEVSENELTEYMVGKGANYQMMQFAQQVGAESPAQLYDMVNNPSNYGANEEQIAPVREQLLKIEKQMEQSLKFSKVQSLVIGCLQANALDKKAINADNNIYAINLVKKSFAELKESDFEVSDKEINAEYAKQKELYKLDTEVRDINYIVVDIKPSDADEAEGAKIFEEALADLRENKGVANANQNENVVVKESTVTTARVTNPKIKEFLASAQPEQLSEVSHVGDRYSVTKLIGSKVETDSVRINIVVAEGDSARQDTILAKLNAGTTLEQIAKEKGVTVAQQDQWMNLMDLNAQDAEAKAKILNAGAGYFVLNSGAQGAVLCNVAEKKAAKTQYDIVEVSYTVIPSEKTTQDLRDKLQSFIIANNKQDKFVAEAVNAGFQAMNARLTNDMPQIGNIKDSRKALQWVFGAKEGEVSVIFDADNGNKILSVALERIVPEGYVPASDKDVKAQLSAKVRTDKMAAKLIEDYSGKANDLAGYAAVMSSKVDTTTVNFNEPFIAMAGYEPELAGEIVGSKVGKLYGPVKGASGVYVYQVNSVDEKGPQLSDEEAANRFMQRFGGYAVAGARRNQTPLMLQILRQNTKIKNNLIKFF